MSQECRPRPLATPRPSICMYLLPRWRLHVVAEPGERRRDQVRPRPDVDHGLDAHRQGPVDHVPEPLGVVGPVGQELPGVLHVVARLSGHAGEQGRGRLVVAAAGLVEGHRRPVGDVPLPDQRRMQRRPAVRVASEQHLVRLVGQERPLRGVEPVDRVPLAEDQGRVGREERRRADQAVPLAADPPAEPLDLVHRQGGPSGEQDAHRQVVGQLGAVGGERQRDRQELFEGEDAAPDQGGELADAVAEAEPGVAGRDAEAFLKDGHLGEFRRDDRRDVLRKKIERGPGSRPDVRRRGRPGRGSTRSRVRTPRRAPARRSARRPGGRATRRSGRRSRRRSPGTRRRSTGSAGGGRRPRSAFGECVGPPVTRRSAGDGGVDLDGSASIADLRRSQRPSVSFMGGFPPSDGSLCLDRRRRRGPGPGGDRVSNGVDDRWTGDDRRWDG